MAETSPNRRAGRIFLKIGGEQYDAKGSFTYNPGGVKRECIAGADKVHGFKEAVQVPFVEGEITDRGDLDLATLQAIEDTTVTLELATGKVFVLRNAWYAADGDVQTEEAVIQCRFEGISGEEVV